MNDKQDRYCCDGLCEQGRNCPMQQQDNVLGYWLQRLKDAFAIFGLIFVIFFAVGYFVSRP